MAAYTCKQFHALITSCQTKDSYITHPGYSRNCLFCQSVRQDGRMVV